VTDQELHVGDRLLIRDEDRLMEVSVREISPSGKAVLLTCKWRGFATKWDGTSEWFFTKYITIVEVLETK
jgi:hypothetical protein